MIHYKFSAFSLVILILLIQSASAQKMNKTEITWEDKLYEKDVKYEDFACRVDDKEAVSEFFEKNPLNRILRVCHNNCASLESFPQNIIPFLPPQIAGQGYIAIHILANKNGRPIYSRAVNGHSIMRRLLQKKACEAKFRPISQKRQNVLLICPNDDCREMQPFTDLSK